MSLLRYRVVDVFTTTPLEGNPVAVFTDAMNIDGETMQKIARELNLPETTFLFPPTDPGCAAKVRIFTPKKEMVFAGHPTIGSALVLLTQGAVVTGKLFSLEEKVGPVAILIEDGAHPMVWLQTPPIFSGRFLEASACARALGLEEADLLPVKPQLMSAGNPTLFVALASKDAVDNAWLDLQGVEMLHDGDSDPFCVFVFARTTAGVYSRMFAPEYGIPEDPGTGSSTGPLAAYMIRHGMIATEAASRPTRFISEQGVKMGRRSLLHVRIAGKNGADGIFVGGNAVSLVDATLKL